MKYLPHPVAIAPNAATECITHFSRMVVIARAWHIEAYSQQVVTRRRMTGARPMVSRIPGSSLMNRRVDVGWIADEQYNALVCTGRR